MSEKEKKLFTDKRWTEPPKAFVIGHSEITEEDRELVRKFKEKKEKYRNKN